MSVAIKGDSHAQYDKVIAVIDLCNALGVNMGLVTARIGT
jgi:biopolymer transport protein ExbD